MDPVLIVAVDRCEDAERNCFCAHNWSEAPTLDAVAEGRSVLREGHRGAPVEETQRLLNQHHPESGALKVDGFYGPKTEAAVRSFQKKMGLEVDGIAGTETMRALADLTVRDLLLDDRFAGLADEIQRSAVNRIDSAAQPADKRRIAFLVTSERFAALPPKDQARVLAVRDTAAMPPAAEVLRFAADARSLIE